MTAARTVVIWNGNAGSVEKAAAIRGQLAARPSTTVLESSSTEDAEAIVKDAVNKGAELVVAAGGDGTINTVVNALRGRESQVQFAALPVGTANDWCYSLGMPDDLAEAVALLDGGEFREIDLAEMETASGSHYFANVATGGNSQRVTEVLTDELKKRWGALCYLRGAVDVVTDLKSFDVEVRFDDGAFEQLSLWNVIIANGRTSAGRLAVAPRASLEDGLLDVVIIREGGLVDLAALAAGFALSGDYTELEQVFFRRAREVRLKAEPSLTFSLDGQLIEQPALAFRICPRAMRVLVGPDFQRAA